MFILLFLNEFWGPSDLWASTVKDAIVKREKSASKPLKDCDTTYFEISKGINILRGGGSFLATLFTFTPIFCITCFNITMYFHFSFCF